MIKAVGMLPGPVDLVSDAAILRLLGATPQTVVTRSARKYLISLGNSPCSYVYSDYNGHGPRDACARARVCEGIYRSNRCNRSHMPKSIAIPDAYSTSTLLHIWLCNGR
jgi:hypothetical protein